MKKFLLLAITFCSFSFYSQISQCSFGSFPPSYTTTPGWTNGSWLAKKFTLATSATLTGLGLNSATNAATYQMAIYTDAGTVPLNSVAVTGIGTITAGYNVLPVQTVTVIPAGNYWIMFNGAASPPVTSAAGGGTMAYQPMSIPNIPTNASASWVNGSAYNVDIWAVINTPSVTVTSPTSVCSGSTVNLIAQGALSYSWNTGPTGNSITVSPTVNTTYTVGGINALGCANIAITSVSIMPLPTVSISGNGTVCAGGSLTLTASGASTYVWSNGSITNPVTINTSSLTIVYVDGGGSNGCHGTASVTINPFPLPTVSVSGNTAVCAGNIATLTANGASTYTWGTGLSAGTLTFAPTSNTSMPVIGKDANGCVGSATAAINVNPLPTVSLAVINPVLCSGQSFTINVSGVNSFTWNVGPISLNLSGTPTITTVYGGTGTDGNGCVNSATTTITVNDCTGFEPETIQNQVNIYPNPSKGIFKLQANKTGAFEVYDLTGRVVSSGQVDSSAIIDLSTKPDGVYFIILHSGTENSAYKLIKE